MGDLLDRREEILKDRVGAEVDLGVDLHAGDEAQLPALVLEVAAAGQFCGKRFTLSLQASAGIYVVHALGCAGSRNEPNQCFA